VFLHRETPARHRSTSAPKPTRRRNVIAGGRGLVFHLRFAIHPPAGAQTSPRRGSRWREHSPVWISASAPRFDFMSNSGRRKCAGERSVHRRCRDAQHPSRERVLGPCSPRRRHHALDRGVSGGAGELNEKRKPPGCARGGFRPRSGGIGVGEVPAVNLQRDGRHFCSPARNPPLRPYFPQ
jgi:hypothetical protein